MRTFFSSFTFMEICLLEPADLLLGLYWLPFQDLSSSPSENVQFGAFTEEIYITLISCIARKGEKDENLPSTIKQHKYKLYMYSKQKRHNTFK